MLLEKIVIGSSIESAYYALVNECYFIPTIRSPLMFYDRSEISLFGLREKSKIWARLNLILGLLSRRIAFEDISKIRILDREVGLSTGSSIFKYQFEQLFVFDPTNIQMDSEIETPHPPTFRVLDDFELSTLGPKRYELESMFSTSGFAKELHFYCSDRVDGADYITDCVVESELTRDQLNSFDYSGSMTRFVVERHLTSIGVYGRLMKYYESGKPKYRKPKVTHVKRVSYETDNNTYRDTAEVKFLSLSIGEIIEEITKR
jgi:hypothetical protein